MLSSDFLLVRNGQPVALHDCPIVSIDRFRTFILEGIASGARLSAMPAWLPEANAPLRLMAVLANPASASLGLLSCEVKDSYPALTPEYPAANWFEREIAEQWDVQPEGHPWLKPIRFQPPRHTQETKSDVSRPSIGMADFFTMEGEESHEVAVGPVHAGVIEPGHFRFLCQGETVSHLEISLGYQHRGVERALFAGPTPRTIHYMETLSGDSTIGHTIAYCRVVEAMSAARPSARAEAIRVIAAELERIANHVGDLGALAGDAGFLPTMSYCGRIRGDVLNLSAMLCGNRFGRGLVVPGGVAYDMDEPLCQELLRRVKEVQHDATSAIELMFESPSMLARLEGIGVLSEELARELGLVGIPARACGISRDVRQEFPYGLYQFNQIPVCTWSSGDCFARAYVRWLEIQQSLEFIREQLHSLPQGPTRQKPASLKPDTLVVSLTEGWRGDICHVATTDPEGRFTFYKIVDPSFHNWFGLACALREQQISDFPLCNKSFNLSYCGHDL